MGQHDRRDQFFRATLRHFAELRGGGPKNHASSTAFPPDWFDLPPDVLADFGAMLFLASLTQYHRKRALADLFASLEPALRLGQYRIFYSDGFARAAITWAGLSPAAEQKFAVDHHPLDPQDWNSGSAIWLVDFLAPFGHVDQIIPLLTQNPDVTTVRTLHHAMDGQRYRIVEWRRPSADDPVHVHSYGVNHFRKVLMAGVPHGRTP